MATVTAYIALGSNLGDREGTLREALRLLGQREGITVTRVSSFIETEPVGVPGQGKYINAAARIETALTPHQLLDAMHEVEAALGRDRSKEQHWGSRTCDLDILLIGDLILNEPGLAVPHPQIHERRFVLEPLAEIAPDVVHPLRKKTMRQLLAELG